MTDVTSGLLSFQLTTGRFPVGECATRDHNDEDDDCSKTGVSSSSSDVEDRRLVSSDLSLTARRDNNERRHLVDGASCWWPDGTSRQRVGDDVPAGGRLIIRDDDYGGLERLAADSAVGRLAMMIQRFAANSPCDFTARSPSSQTTPFRRLMTSSGDVTSSRDCARYFCHVCPYVGKPLRIVCLSSLVEDIATPNCLPQLSYCLLGKHEAQLSQRDSATAAWVSFAEASIPPKAMVRPPPQKWPSGSPQFLIIIHLKCCADRYHMT